MRPPPLCRNLSLFSQHHFCFLLPCLCCHISHPSGSYSTVSSLHQPCALVGGSNKDFPCLFVLQSFFGDGFFVGGLFFFLQRLTEESKLELEICTARGRTSFPMNLAFGGVKTMGSKMKKQNVFESLGCSFSEKRLEGEGGHNLSPFLCQSISKSASHSPVGAVPGGISEKGSHSVQAKFNCLAVVPGTVSSACCKSALVLMICFFLAISDPT